MKNKKIFMLLFVIGLSCVLLGSTWAFFNYANTSDINREIITGEVFLDFYNESDEIHLENEFPMNATTARARTDNTITFDIAGRDTYSKPLYYEIDLINGEVASGKEEDNRILAKYLKFDLSEDGELVVGNVSFNDLNNRRIYVTTIPAGTETNLIHSYELRMWIDENLMISDTNEDADYSTSEYEDLFASVKVRVVGDFLEKSVYGIMADYTNWPEDIYNNRSNITKINVIDDTEDNIMDRYYASSIKGDMTYEASPVTNVSNNSNKKYQVKMLANEVDEIFEDSGTDYFFPTGYSKVLVWLEDDPNNTGKYILNIGTTGYTYISSGHNLFAGFTNTTEMNLDNLRTDFASSMNAMFASDSHLTSLDVSHFNTSNVTDMVNMFVTCSSLTSLDVSNFNTSKVANMLQMFCNCSSLTDLDLSNFDTSNVTNMSVMFSNCSSLTSLDVSNFDTGNVTNMSAMFYNCSSLIDLDLSNFNTGSVTSSGFGGLFDGTGLVNLNLSGWDVSKETSMSSCIGSMCFPSTLKNLNLSNWHINSTITSLSYLFSGKSNLESIDLNGWDAYNISDVTSMFSGCSSLKYVNLNAWTGYNVTAMQNMFNGCSNLEVLDVSSWHFVYYGTEYASREYRGGTWYISSQGQYIGAYPTSKMTENSAKNAFSGLNTNIKIYVNDLYQAYWILNGSNNAQNGHDSNWTYDNVIVKSNYIENASPEYHGSSSYCVFTGISNLDYALRTTNDKLYARLTCHSDVGFENSNLTSDDFVISGDMYAMKSYIMTPIKEKIEDGFVYTIPIINDSRNINCRYRKKFSLSLKNNVLKDNNGNYVNSITNAVFHNYCAGSYGDN